MADEAGMTMSSPSETNSTLDSTKSDDPFELEELVEEDAESDIGKMLAITAARRGKPGELLKADFTGGRRGKGNRLFKEKKEKRGKKSKTREASIFCKKRDFSSRKIE
jgi:hypothetical protein